LQRGNLFDGKGGARTEPPLALASSSANHGNDDSEFAPVSIGINETQNMEFVLHNFSLQRRRNHSKCSMDSYWR
jgi:hypothetical protein